MHQLSEYDLIIFDCDGVILDSNQLKIDAMGKALERFSFVTPQLRAQCVDFFAKNFGKSRFYHVNHFVDNILPLADDAKEDIYNQVLAAFADVLATDYQNAELTPYFAEMLPKLDATLAVASGSEEQELQRIFTARGFAEHYAVILGSPTKKTDNVATILKDIPHKRAVMIGDAVSDFEAAQDNAIDFIAYTPLSNVPEKMHALSKEHGFLELREWPVNFAGEEA